MQSAQGPQYVLQPSLKREFVPQIFLMIFLGILLFLGFLFNVNLLDLELPQYFTYLIAGLIAGVILINLVLVYRNILKESYMFYPDKIEYSGKKPKRILFFQITGISFKKNLIDKVFNTAAIVLEPDFEIKNIESSEQVYLYVQKLIQYYKANKAPINLYK